MKEKKQKQKKTCTYIGGQAVMEGVMMRGKTAMATAVRDPEGKVQVESERLAPPEKQNKFFRLPFIRGVANFLSSMMTGSRVLMRSAEVAESEEGDAPTKAEVWLAEKHKINLSGFFNTLAMIFGVLLAVGLFIVLPQFLTRWIVKWGNGFVEEHGILYNLIEGGMRLVIFVLYIVFVALIPTLKRVFMYHGAEHKTITCYELGKDLTVENVKTCSRVHDRCGTTFLFLVMVVSILVFSLVTVPIKDWISTQSDSVNFVLRLLIKILLLPVIAGVSYEILRLLSKTQSPLVFIFKLPGLLLQRLTTREPEDGMIECAIAAFKKVLEMDADPTVPETVFATQCKMSELLANTKKRFEGVGIEEDEAEWIFALLLNIPKSAVATEERILRLSMVKKLIAVADERLTGRPLWYVIGDADFYGYKIKVDERVLIPRRETEELALLAVGAAENGADVLDLCTGSGAIAIAVSKELEKRGVAASVTAVDISSDALALAKENAELNEANVKFVQSDLFARVRGRYDVIVTNPPYIPTAEIQTLQREVRDHEPHLALDGGADGLDFYRRIAENASKYLKKGGVVIAEVGLGQAKDVVKLFKYCDYSMIVKDMQGVDRFVKIVF